MPLTLQNSAMALPLVPSPGADIMDCYDQAAKLVALLGCCVQFDFNEVSCGVRPDDVRPEVAKDRREVFYRNYHREQAKGGGIKICYANA